MDCAAIGQDRSFPAALRWRIDVESRSGVFCVDIFETELLPSRLFPIPLPPGTEPFDLLARVVVEGPNSPGARFRLRLIRGWCGRSLPILPRLIRYSFVPQYFDR